MARRDEVKGKIDGLVGVEESGRGAEGVNLLSEDAVKVSGARESRPNRLRDLDIEEAKLHPLREMLGLAPDADVAGMMPEQGGDRSGPDACGRGTGEAALSWRALRAGFGARRRACQIEARIAEDRVGGIQPAARRCGLAVRQPSRSEGEPGRAARRNAEEEKSGHSRKTWSWFGGPTADELAAMSCPAPRMSARNRLRGRRSGSDIAEQEGVKRKADEEIAAGARRDRGP